MNIRKKANSNPFLHAMHLASIDMQPHEMQIYNNVEKILYEQSSTQAVYTLLKLSASENDNHSFWDNKTAELIAYLQEVLASKQMAQNKMRALVYALVDFVNSRNYEIAGRNIKSSYLGFTVISTGAGFQEFKNGLQNFSETLQPIAKSANTNANMLFSLVALARESISALSTRNKFVDIGLLLVSQALIASAQGIDKDHLVAHYPLDGNALDVYGNNNGVMWGVIPCEDEYDNPNGALCFSGEPVSYVIGPADKFPVLQRTVAVRMKLEEFPIHQGMDRGGYVFSYGGSSTCGTSWIMQINEYCVTSPNSYSVQSYCSVNLMEYHDSRLYGTPSEWFHFAVTTHYRDGTTVYVNGEKIPLSSPQNVYISNTVTSGTIFGIGTLIDSTGKVPTTTNCGVNFRGAMSELAIWSHAKNATQIKADANRKPKDPYVPPASSDDKFSDTFVNITSVAAGVVTGVALATGAYGVKCLLQCCGFFKEDEAATPLLNRSRATGLSADLASVGNVASAPAQDANLASVDNAASAPANAVSRRNPSLN